MGRSTRKRGNTKPKTPVRPATEAGVEEEAEENTCQPPPMLMTPEQLGEALRDMEDPLQPMEGLRADRDPVDQEPPPRNDTLQENNNASMEEVPPPHPFPVEGNEETITEVPPEYRQPEQDDQPWPEAATASTLEPTHATATAPQTPTGITARGGRERFCVRIHVLNTDTGGPFRPALFTPSIIQDLLNLLLRRAGVPPSGEVDTKPWRGVGIDTAMRGRPS